MQHFMLCVTYTTKPGMREPFIQEVVASGRYKKLARKRDVSAMIITVPFGAASYEGVKSIKNCKVVGTWLGKSCLA